MGLVIYSTVAFRATGPTDWRPSGEPAGLTPSRVAAFLSKIKVVGQCWEWCGAYFRTGYGMFNAGRVDGRQRTEYAHRISYALANGPVPHGLHVLHRCDNEPCVYPPHLYAGTPFDNMQDRKRAGRYGGERPQTWLIDPALRRRLVSECLSAKRYDGTVARLAKLHDIPFRRLATAVRRAREREFQINTTGSMSAHR
jgi:hypothetical protein